MSGTHGTGELPELGAAGGPDLDRLAREASATINTAVVKDAEKDEAKPPPLPASYSFTVKTLRHGEVELHARVMSVMERLQAGRLMSSLAGINPDELDAATREILGAVAFLTVALTKPRPKPFDDLVGTKDVQALIDAYAEVDSYESRFRGLGEPVSEDGIG